MPFKEQIVYLSEQISQLYQEGQYEPAIEMATQVRLLARQELGEEHQDYVSSLYNLAQLYNAMGDDVVAESLYRQVLSIGRTVLGENHPDLATTWHNLARMYESRGDYAAAEPLYQQALSIQRQALGEQHPELASTLNNLAELYHTLGNYALAEPLYQQALQMTGVVSGLEHPEYAASLNNLAELYRVMGRYTAAEPLYQQALQITSQALEPLDYATSLNNLALLYLAMGRYTAAEPLFQQALTIARQSSDSEPSTVATYLHNLALLYVAMGNYAAAEPLCHQVLAIDRQTLGQEHPDYAMALNNLAELYRLMSNYAAAEPLYRQANDILQLALGEEHPDVAIILNNLAELYQAMAHYALAEPLYQQALAIKHHALGEEHPEVANTLNNLARLYEAMGYYAKAEPLHLQALAIRQKVLGEEHPDVAMSLNNLAELYKMMGHYAEAEPLYHQALAIDRQVLGEEHPDYAIDLNNLALLYQTMGNYAVAEPLYHQALAIRRQVLGEEHPQMADSLNNLALLYNAMGNYQAAELLYLQALGISRSSVGENHPSYAIDLNNLALLYAATKRESEAMPLLEEAAAIDEQIMRQVFVIGSESQRMAYLETLQWRLGRTLSLLVKHLSDSLTAVQGGVELVQRRKAIGAEALAVQRDAVFSGRYPTLQSKLRKSTTLRQQIAKKSLAGPEKEGLDTHLQLLGEWKAQKERLEAELARQIPEMNLEQKLRTAGRQAVAEALSEGSVLIEFVRFDLFDFKAVPARNEAQWKPARYLAFVLHAGAPDNVQMIDLGEAKAIDQMIANFRASLTHEAESRGTRHGRPFSPTSDSGTSNGTALRAALFDPLVAYLDGHTRLFLAPDGDLNRLPFEVLPTPSGDGERLIDSYQISYLGVGRDVLRFGAPSTGQPTAPLVVADPDFDLSATTNSGADEVPRLRQSRSLSRSSLQFNRLSGTRTEGEQIATMLGVKPLLGQDALETILKACQSPRILHIATHGFFLSNQKRDPNQDSLGVLADGKIGRLSGAGLENPLLRSGLALAGANTWLKGQTLPVEAEDGILTAEDVSGLDLLATELVVLSACETGLGEVQVGEGVFGLRRAFMLAGAKTLVMSLWKVPDRQTQELMSDFYRRILAGEPRAEALRQAQLAMKVKYYDPYYWGAFICQGDPSALPRA